MGTNLDIAYFDQLRAQFIEEKSLIDNIADASDLLTLHGKQRHVISYLQDFLFTPDQARSPVKNLSGGERNRLLLAKLFTRAMNVLVLDEPTNDLDMETLELLEELLLEYEGTLLLVSHDRTFINNVVTNTLVLEGDGRVGEYIGGYDDWLRQRIIIQPEKPKKEKIQKPRFREKPKKITFNEKQELDILPEKIENLEGEQQHLFEKMSNPDFYKGDGAQVALVQNRLNDIETQLKSLYERWEYLDSLPLK